MITNKGKEIIAKYLIGTAPSFASYIAVGCGAKPRPIASQITGASSSGDVVNCDSVDGLWIGAAVYKVLAGTGSIPDNAVVTEILTPTDFRLSATPTVALSGATLQIQTDDTKECLDFEMFRVPIISRGYINENGTDKIIFTGELPTEERYEISEIGIFSAGLNVSAGTYDSKTVLAFSEAENWKYGNGLEPVFISSSLTPNAFNLISTYEDIFETSADNPTFLDPTRSGRYEGTRYLNNMIMMRGSTSLITGNPQSFVIADDAKYIQLSGQTFNFSKNSSADLLKIAFSLVSVDGNSTDVPNRVRIVAKFSNSSGTQYANLESEVTNSTSLFSQNRYFVASSRFDELAYSPVFSWEAMTDVKIYVSVIETIGVTQIEATAGNVKLTVSPAHGIPVDATITNATKVGSNITYLATNSFTAGDTVSVSGIVSTPPGELNITDAVVTESTSTYFKVKAANSTAVTYTSGGSAIIENKYVEFTHETVSYTGTHKITSVPSTTEIIYYVDGASLSSTPLSPEGKANLASKEYFVALDAIRLDNVSTVNPLYGMTGYALIQNQDAVTVLKNPNTNNYIEFRVNLGAL